MRRKPQPSTFSIVAHDSEAEEWGIAVQSKFLAAAAVVSWAEANAGAVATQARANMKYGPDGLNLLSDGESASEVVNLLTESDEGASDRQLAVVDSQGQAAAFTGEDCLDWAGHHTGDGYSCQGNILAGPQVVKAMAEDFESSSDPLADRLISALHAGQQAGGDRRGQQSAGLLVVREEGSYGGTTDRYIDLRVDDHPAPIDKLSRLLNLFYLYFEQPDPDMMLVLQGDVAQETKEHLAALGYKVDTDSTDFGQDASKALDDWVAQENFEMRMQKDGMIDPDVLKYLREEYEGKDIH